MVKFVIFLLKERALKVEGKDKIIEFDLGYAD